jgi:hypothetical protein
MPKFAGGCCCGCYIRDDYFGTSLNPGNVPNPNYYTYATGSWELIHPHFPSGNRLLRPLHNGAQIKWYSPYSSLDLATAIAFSGHRINDSFKISFADVDVSYTVQSTGIINDLNDYNIFGAKIENNINTLKMPFSAYDTSFGFDMSSIAEIHIYNDNATEATGLSCGNLYVNADGNNIVGGFMLPTGNPDLAGHFYFQRDLPSGNKEFSITVISGYDRCFIENISFHQRAKGACRCESKDMSAYNCNNYPNLFLEIDGFLDSVQYRCVSGTILQESFSSSGLCDIMNGVFELEYYDTFGPESEEIAGATFDYLEHVWVGPLITSCCVPPFRYYIQGVPSYFFVNGSGYPVQSSGPGATGYFGPFVVNNAQQADGCHVPSGITVAVLSGATKPLIEAIQYYSSCYSEPCDPDDERTFPYFLSFGNAYISGSKFNFNLNSILNHTGLFIDGNSSNPFKSSDDTQTICNNYYLYSPGFCGGATIPPQSSGSPTWRIYV